jgi:hypothetical protein
MVFLKYIICLHNLPLKSLLHRGALNIGCRVKKKRELLESTKDWGNILLLLLWRLYYKDHFNRKKLFILVKFLALQEQ